MASSGAAEKPKFHEGSLKPYAHEELNPASDVSWAMNEQFGDNNDSHIFFGFLLLIIHRWDEQRTPSNISWLRSNGRGNAKWPMRRYDFCVKT